MPYNYIFSFLWIWVAALHPFYVSLTDIRYNPVEQRIEMAQRIFRDDLEVALAKKHQVKVDFQNPENPQELEKLIEAYLLEMNEIHINGEKIVMEYLRYELEEDTIWFYLEGKTNTAPYSAKVRNSVLIHQFGEQQNIVNFYEGERLKSVITFKGKEWGELMFN